MRLDLDCSSLASTNIQFAKISDNKNRIPGDRINTYSIARVLCPWWNGRVCWTLDWSTSGLISFSNSPDYIITLFSECSIADTFDKKFVAVGSWLHDKRLYFIFKKTEVLLRQRTTMVQVAANWSRTLQCQKLDSSSSGCEFQIDQRFPGS